MNRNLTQLQTDIRNGMARRSCHEVVEEILSKLTQMECWQMNHWKWLSGQICESSENWIFMKFIKNVKIVKNWK